MEKWLASRNQRTRESNATVIEYLIINAINFYKTFVMHIVVKLLLISYESNALAKEFHIIVIAL